MTRRYSQRDGFSQIMCQVSSCSVSKGAVFTAICTGCLPLKPSGTRHEHRQAPPHPYSKLPTATIRPNSSFTDSSLTTVEYPEPDERLVTLYECFLDKPTQIVKKVFSLFLYRMPCFILHDLKRSQVDIHLDLELTLEILRHPPRIPADAASPVLEFVGHQYPSFLIHDLKRRRQ